MSTLQGLNKIVAPVLGEYGYKYSGKRDPISWVFEKKIDLVSRFIIFEKIRANPDQIRVLLHTSVCLERVHLNQLDRNLNHMGIVYQNKEEFYSTLTLLLDIIIKQGLDWLEIMSKPDVFPDLSVCRLFMERLSINSNELNSPIITENDDIADFESQIRLMSAEGHNEPDWAFIIDFSIQFGEFIRTKFGGEWAVRGEQEYPFLIEVGSNRRRKICPLIQVAQYWGKPYYLPYSLKRIILSLENQLT